MNECSQCYTQDACGEIVPDRVWLTLFSKPVAVAVVVLGCGAVGNPATAGSLDCGDPPPVADENLKADIQGKAHILSKYLGDIGLGGRIEKSRKEIFSKYKNANERSDAYLQYQICVYLSQDESLTSSQKVDKLLKIKQEFSRPGSELRNDRAVATLAYWSEARHIISECDLEGALKVRGALTADTFSTFSSHYRTCANRLRTLPINNVDESLVARLESWVEKMDMAAETFVNASIVMREEQRYLALNQPIPLHLGERMQDIHDEVMAFKASTGGVRIDEDMNSLRGELVSRYNLEFRPLTFCAPGCLE